MDQNKVNLIESIINAYEANIEMSAKLDAVIVILAKNGIITSMNDISFEIENIKSQPAYQLLYQDLQTRKDNLEEIKNIINNEGEDK